MATFNSNTFTVQPVIAPRNAGETITVFAEYSLTAALALNDVIQMLKVPAGCAIVDAVLVADDLDTGGAPAITLDVGIAGADTDQLFAASTVAQAGGVVRPTIATAFRDAATAADRTVQVLVKAGPATGAASGKIGLSVSYRAKQVNGL
jgi:hypothetical protein